MKVLKLLLIILLGRVIPALGQDYKVLFNDVLSGKSTYSASGIKLMASKDNAYDYMSIGYFIDANTIMYKKTGDKSYVDNNIEVLRLMFPLEKRNSRSARVMKVAQNNQNSSINGQESLVFEGYFYRYLGEFLYIIKNDNLYTSDQTNLLSVLKNSFDKWSKKSFAKYKDNSNLYHQRFHIGATWAMTSLFLYRLTGDNDYRSFYSIFDKQLREALIKKVVNGKSCYIWNATYPTNFTQALKSSFLNTSVIQDVSHGNHVVEYIITSYELSTGIYNKTDLQYLANTVTQLIWKKTSNSFVDNVDGTMSNDKSFQNSGWKQSDGWMKLSQYTPGLKDIYSSYYNINSRRINNSFLGLQYIANLY